MKTILVPTDFSPCADQAAQLAIKLARMGSYKLHFLHLMSTPLNWLQLSDEQQKMYADIRERIRKANGDLDALVHKAEGEGVAASKFIKYDDSDQSILDHIEDHGMNMVIMGSHGAKGFKEFFLGTNAQRIVRQSQVPVLITKPGDHDGALKSIAFISDFDDEMIEHFRPTLSLATLIGAKVRLVFINVPLNFTDTPTIQARMRLYADIDPSLIEAKDIYNFCDFEEAIKYYCAEHEVSLLSMLTHGRKGIDRFFAGSLTESIINHVNLPVLSKNANVKI
jgi:nucleotide-binding universal stress UspA family protein